MEYFNKSGIHSKCHAKMLVALTKVERDANATPAAREYPTKMSIWNFLR